MKSPTTRRMAAASAFPALFLASTWLSPGCSESEPQDQGNAGGQGGTATTTTGNSSSTTDFESGDIEVPGMMTTVGGQGGAGGSGPLEAQIIDTLPKKFTKAENGGGYRIVGELNGLDLETSASCVNVLRVIVRDFRQEHIDFGEPKPTNWMPPGVFPGLILPDLDPKTRKPKANPKGKPTDVIEHFDDWYVNTKGVNMPYVMDMWLEPQGDFFVFDTEAFFPLEAPWNEFSKDDEQLRDGELKNFLFTTEIHTAFEYKGGEVFNFRGDDDVWVFINYKLAVDIGGIHGAAVGDIDLTERAEELGLVPGEVYSLDMFQAERNPVGSNFRVQTSLDFKECSVLAEDIIR